MPVRTIAPTRDAPARPSGYFKFVVEGRTIRATVALMPRRYRWRWIAWRAGHDRTAERDADLDRRRCDGHAPRDVLPGGAGRDGAGGKSPMSSCSAVAVGIGSSRASCRWTPGM